MQFSRASRAKYILWFFILLVIEILIAVFVNDKIIRPYAGDFLVVILLYCMLMSLTKMQVKNALVIVLVFSFAIEFFQIINIVKVLQYQPPRIIMILLGSSFSVWDLLAYSLGIILTAYLEYQFQPEKRSVKMES